VLYKDNVITVQLCVICLSKLRIDGAILQVLIGQGFSTGRAFRVRTKSRT